MHVIIAQFTCIYIKKVIIKLCYIVSIMVQPMLRWSEQKDVYVKTLIQSQRSNCLLYFNIFWRSGAYCFLFKLCWSFLSPNATSLSCGASARVYQSAVFFCFSLRMGWNDVEEKTETEDGCAMLLCFNESLSWRLKVMSCVQYAVDIVKKRSCFNYCTWCINCNYWTEPCLWSVCRIVNANNKTLKNTFRFIFISTT